MQAFGKWASTEPLAAIAFGLVLIGLFLAAWLALPQAITLYRIVKGLGEPPQQGNGTGSGPTQLGVDTSRFLTREDIAKFVTQDEMEAHLNALRFELGRLETTVDTMAREFREHREDFLVSSTEVRGTLTQMADNIRGLTMVLQNDSARLAKQLFDGMRDVQAEAVKAIDERLAKKSDS